MIVNILGFHLFLAHGGYGVPVVVLAVELYLAWTYRDAFAPMLRMRSVPGTTGLEGIRQKELVVAEAR